MGGMRMIGTLALSLLVLLAMTWAGLALWYQLPGGWIRGAGLTVWVALGLAVLVLLWRGHSAVGLLMFALLAAGFLLWWQGIQASSTRVWADDVAQQLRSRIDGEQVTLHNVRNFEWRGPDDYDVRWETRQYDLNRLRSVDLALSYWMGPAIAHTLVSFGFDDGRYLTFSIEIRKQRGEQFSAVAGFFRQYETSLIAADERDILGVRTQVRGEDVYLYRVMLPPQARRSLFLAYLAEAEALARAPRWYNTATSNCTTVVFEMVRRVVGGLPLDYRLLLSGYLPEYLHRVGGLAPGFDVEALRAAGRITERARSVGADADFSSWIRQGVPGAANESLP